MAVTWQITARPFSRQGSANPLNHREGAGDTWTWTALDADSKLLVSWLLGERDGQAAYDFMMDLAERLTSRVQLTSDGLRLYEGAVEDAFGADVDYAQLIKVFGDPPREGRALQPGNVQGVAEREELTKT